MTKQINAKNETAALGKAFAEGRRPNVVSPMYTLLYMPLYMPQEPSAVCYHGQLRPA